MVMNCAPSVLMTLFHMTFEVVSSEVHVVSSPSYMSLRNFSPAVIHTLVGSFFLLTVVNYVPGVGYDSVCGDVFNAFEVKVSYWVCPFSVIC